MINKGETIAVALSGGADSMALIHYLSSISNDFGFKVIAINVEHGIRGEDSISDSLFVKDYCDKNDIPLLFYSVDAPKKAKDDKLSIEQAARLLRYECFYRAISEKKCDKVATAHHQSDNAESILFNLFRGTGLKGLCGIKGNFDGLIIRPFLSISKDEINEYVSKNQIPFVQDKTNLDDQYTRNYIRLNILPKIKEIFPDIDKNLYRLGEILSLEDDFLDQTAKSALVKDDEFAFSISLDVHPAIFSRAVILALKNLGVEKDWEKQHVDSALSLIDLKNGSKATLLNGVVAIREYDRIVLYLDGKKDQNDMPFTIGNFVFFDKTYSIVLANNSVDLKSGLFADLDKIPKTAVIRTKKDGDKFTKFGGGTKLLSDYFTDKKIPLRIRDNLPVLADGNQILVIFGVAVSENVKVDEQTKTILRFI